MVNVIKSEYLKLRTNKWVMLTIAATIVMTPFLVMFLHDTPNDVSWDYIVTQVIESYYLGQAGIIVTAMLFFGQEFIKSTLRSSLLSIPKRVRFVGAKLLVLLLTVLVMWLLVVGITFVIISWGYGFVLNVSQVGELLVITFLILLAFLSLAVICASVVMLTQSITVSIATALALLLGLGNILLQFSPAIKFLPILAPMNLFFLSERVIYLPTAYGLLVQGLWAVSLLTIATKVFIVKSVR